MNRKSSRRTLLKTGAALAIPVGVFARGHDAQRRAVVLFNSGGLSHLDTFDPKPLAPPEIRGPFAAIPTTSPRIHLTELLPRHAKLANHFSLVRTVHYDGAASHEHGADRILAPLRALQCDLPDRMALRDTSVGELNWDTHGREPFSTFQHLRDVLCPAYDQTFSGLIENLLARDALRHTLVCSLTEFGRSPRVNAAGGRDHWTKCFSVCFAGGGVVGGRVIGKSDDFGAHPIERPATPEEVFGTILYSLGISPNANTGRVRSNYISDLF